MKDKDDKSFVLDESNKKAYELIKTISKAMMPLVYNPAIIYGKSGTGKTHLMSLAKETLEKEGKKVVLLTGEEFLARLINAIRNMPEFSTEKFCEQFYEADVLIVEDIQYIKDKESTQKEMANIADYFISNQKQIVFTMNCTPERLDTFETELQIRLKSSVQVEIEESTKELRRKIVENFCEEKAWDLSETVTEKIAATTQSAAEVIGVMKRMMFYVDEMNEPLNDELLEKVQNLKREKRIYE